MAEVGFSDIDSATAWFETQTVEMRCAMASRAALRVVANSGRFEHPEKDRLTLSVLRAILTSAGRGLGRPADVADFEDLERSARSAARSAADSATYSAFSALSASAASAALSAVLFDSNQTLERLEVSPVWGAADLPDPIAAAHADFLAFLASHQDWAFWRQWYQEMWEGTFRDWPLALEVATLPNELWEGENALARVAEAIREIEARFLSENLPQIEDVFETESGLYNVRSVVSNPSKLVDSVISRVAFALNLALQSNACDLNEMSIAAKLLRHALENCADDPNALEQFFGRPAL